MVRTVHALAGLAFERMRAADRLLAGRTLLDVIETHVGAADAAGQDAIRAAGGPTRAACNELRAAESPVACGALRQAFGTDLPTTPGTDLE